MTAPTCCLQNEAAAARDPGRLPSPDPGRLPIPAIAPAASEVGDESETTLSLFCRLPSSRTALTERKAKAGLLQPNKTLQVKAQSNPTHFEAPIQHQVLMLTVGEATCIALRGSLL